MADLESFRKEVLDFIAENLPEELRVGNRPDLPDASYAATNPMDFRVAVRMRDIRIFPGASQLPVRGRRSMSEQSC